MGGVRGRGGWEFLSGYLGQGEGQGRQEGLGGICSGKEDKEAISEFPWVSAWEQEGETILATCVGKGMAIGP